jgi:hypothetical protein
MTATIENTVNSAALAAAAAAGLGKKARTMTITTANGMTRATANAGEVWVDVIAATGEMAYETGVIPPRPAAAGCTADVKLPGHGLRRIVDGIVTATDTDSSRYALGGTLVEIAEGCMLNVIGTDGKRLHAGFLQPSSIHGQAAPIVAAGQWEAAIASVRAVLRATGVKAGRVNQTIDRGELRIMVGTHAGSGGEVVQVWWTGSGIEVGATALAVAGRFPRWRDCLPENAPAAYQKPIHRLTVDVAVVAAEVAEFIPLHRAAEKAGKAAHKAAQAEKKARRQPTGPAYQIDRGIRVHAAGMIGRGVEWVAAVPTCPVEVILDQRFLADAMTAAESWSMTADVCGSDGISAITIETGDCGERFTAVIMPMAAD